MAFVYSNLGGGLVATCGGTALAPNVVLTAAHCVVNPDTNRYLAPSQVRVVFGQNNPSALLDSGSLSGGQVLDFKTPGQAGSLITGGSTNDIALLELAQRAPGTLPVVPVTRPDLWGPGTTATLLGWGRTNDSDPNSQPSSLMAGNMPINSDASCSATVPGFDSTVMMCAGDGLHVAPCEGDSGGPLLVSDRAGGLDVAGVVNFGGPCQLVGSSSVFARVGGSVLGGFIAQWVGQLQRAAEQGTSASLPSGPTTQPPTLSISAPSRVRARKTFRFTVSGTDARTGALLDLFVTPGLGPCAATPAQEAARAQQLIAARAVNAGFSLAEGLKPIRGASRLCAYLYEGAPGSAPDATATALFTTKRHRHR
jgi:secreted trypsin-like serine protease